MSLPSDIYAFAFSADEDLALLATWGADWDEDLEDLLPFARLLRVRRSDGAQVVLEERTPEPDQAPPPMGLHLSPDGRWGVALVPGRLRVYEGARLALDRPLVGSSSWYERWQQDLVRFTPDGRLLLLMPAVERRLQVLSLPALEVLAELDVDDGPAPLSLALLADGALLLNQRYAIERRRLPDLKLMSGPERVFGERYPAIDVAALGQDRLLRFAPMLQQWYDREDQGTLFGASSLRRRGRKGGATERWTTERVVELYGEHWLDGPGDWDLASDGARATVVHRHPKEWTQLSFARFPSGATGELSFSSRPEAFRLNAAGDALWVLTRGSLERRALPPLPPPKEIEAEARRLRLRELSVGTGSRWAWELILKELGAIASSAELTATVEALQPRLAAWRADQKLPSARWAPDDPRLALCPLRRVLEVDGIGAFAVAELPGDPERYLAAECSVRDARLSLLRPAGVHQGGPRGGPGPRRQPLAELRASGKGVILEPGALLASPDGRTLVASLRHADPLRWCEGSAVTPLGGGQQVIVLHDGVVVGQLRDRFAPVDDEHDNRVHSAAAPNLDFTALFVWAFGSGQLSRVALPSWDFEATVPLAELSDLALSPDGRWLAVVDVPRSALYCAETLAPLCELGPEGAAHLAAFDASGERLFLVRAGDTRGALRRGALDLTLSARSFSADGRSSAELWRQPWRIPVSPEQLVGSDPPRVTLRLARCGADMRLIWGVEDAGELGVLELPSLRQAKLSCQLQGSLGVSASGEDLLIGLEHEVLRWTPALSERGSLNKERFASPPMAGAMRRRSCSTADPK